MATPSWVVMGLGNPGEGYRGTRHNAGRDLVHAFAITHNFPPFVHKASAHALVSKGDVSGISVTLVLPEVAMNLSGKAALPFVKSVRAAKTLLVVRDELDLPVGTIKMTAHGRGSGGHRGVESIMRSVKTKDFLQLKIGISSATAAGKLKKPSAGEEVIEHVLGKYSPKQKERLQQSFTQGIAAIETLIRQGVEAGIQTANTPSS